MRINRLNNILCMGSYPNYDKSVPYLHDPGLQQRTDHIVLLGCEEREQPPHLLRQTGTI